MSFWHNLGVAFGFSDPTPEERQKAATAFNQAQVQAQSMGLDPDALNPETAAGRAYASSQMHNNVISDLAHTAPIQATSHFVNSAIAYVPTQASRAIAAGDLASSGVDWSQAWAATSAKGADINGVHVANLTGGQAVYGTLLHPLAASRRDYLTGNTQGTQQLVHDSQDTWSGRIAGGALDVAMTWYADPTLLLGKAARLSRAANSVADATEATGAVEAAQQINKGDVAAQNRLSPSRLIPGQATGLFSKGMAESGQRLFRFITSTDNKSATELHGLSVMLRRTPDSAPVLGLFDQAAGIKDLDLQRQVKLDIIGAAQGSAVSRSRLIETAPDIAAAMTRGSKAPEGREAIDGIFEAFGQGGPLTPATMQARTAALDAARSTFDTPANQAELESYKEHLARIHNQLDGLGMIADNAPLEFAGLTALDHAKAGIRSSIAKNVYYAPGTAGRGVQVLHWATSQRFRGSIATDNIGMGHQELMDHLVRTKLFSAQERGAISRNFLTADTQEARVRIVDNIESRKIALVAAKYNMTPERVNEMVQDQRHITSNGRQYATTELERARLNGDDTVLLTNPVTGEVTSIKRALLETHLANNVHLDDVHNIEDIVKSYQRDVPLGERLKSDAAMGAAKFNGAADRANHIWRLAVLGRPGLLVRTQIDTQARNLAVMGGTAYVASAVRGLGHTLGSPLSRDEIARVDADAERLQEIDDLRNEAEMMRHVANEADPQMSIRMPVTTLDARAGALRGESSGSLPAGGDAAESELNVGQVFESPQALLDRAKANEDRANFLESKGQVGYANKLGAKTKTRKFGKGQTADFRAYADAQQQRDIPSALYPGGRPSEHLAGVAPSESVGDALRRAHQRKYAKIVEDSADWKSYDPGHPMWSAAWVRTTDQIRNSYVGRKVLKNGNLSTADLLKSLFNDPKVKQSYDKLNEGESMNDWLARVIDHVAAAAPNRAIRDALLDHGHMAPTDVEKLFDSTGAKRFDIQGPSLSPIGAKRLDKSFSVKNGMEKFVEAMSDKPDLMWGRHPLYVNRADYHFQGLAAREFARHPEWSRLPHDVQAHIDTVARHRAIQDVRQTMYDTAKYTGAHNSLRYVSPFLGAWQDAMESWSRLFYDDPARASGFSKVWNAPNRAGLVVDENGNPIPPGGQANQSFLLLPADLSNNFKTGKKWSIRKDSLNSIFQGAQWYTPGVGPIVQVPFQEIVARYAPEFGAGTDPLTKTLLPFGTPKVRPGVKGAGEDLVDDVSPSWARALYGAFSGNDNLLAYQSSINQQIIAARQAGKPIPSRAQLDKVAGAQARNAGFFKAMSIGLLGFSGVGSNVADFYKKQYDLMQQNAAVYKAQGKTVAEAFGEQFPEAAGLNFGFTKSATGIQATLKGFDASKIYAKEIKSNKEFGWFYLGSDNVGGDFSQVAYNAQFSRGERTPQTKDQLLDASLAQDGWNKYQQFMQQVDNRLVELGLHSLDQSAASDVKAVRDKFVADLSKSNPSWAKDFTTGADPSKLQRFIDTIASPALSDPKLKNRSDIQLLGQYLALRDQALQQLNAAGYKSLSAGAAQQLRDVLNAAGTDFARQNLGFQQIWDRMLQKEVLPTHAEQLEQREAS